MSELTLKLEHVYGIDKEFNSYMLNFNGIEKINIDSKTLDINIKYDEKKIDINRIKLEVLFFLGLNNIPSLLAFDKNSKEKLTEHSLSIKNICCEYCLKGMIEELLTINGIDKAECKYDYVNKQNVLINISYDKNILDNKKIDEIEKNLNEY